jgi:hypothetical protein
VIGGTVTNPSGLTKDPIEGDVPVACTVSGAVYTLRKVVGGETPKELEVALRGLERDGVNMRFVGVPCSDCRFTVSTDRDLGKRSTCEYRPLRGPLYVPRQTGALPTQERGSPPLS